MSISQRRKRVARWATCVLAGAVIMQLGPLCSLGLNSGVAAFNFGSLLDENGSLFGGLISPCGRPNVQYVDVNGNPMGTVQFAEDDLLVDCPYTEVEVTDATGL